MKKLVLAAILGLGMFGMLGVANLNAAENLSEGQFKQLFNDCLGNENTSSCQRLVDSGQLASVEQCNKKTCSVVGGIYKAAENYQQAIKYLEKACGLNDFLGCAGLASCYYNGQGVEQNYNTAFKFHKKTCELNYMPSCFMAGVMYYEGQGVKQDFANARKYYEKACNAKNEAYDEACNNLGILYGNGQGVRQNFSTAKKYFGKACDLGDQMGCDNYRLYNEQGIQ